VFAHAIAWFVAPQHNATSRTKRGVSSTTGAAKHIVPRQMASKPVLTANKHTRKERKGARRTYAKDY
jgi:hypothetical protein